MNPMVDVMKRLQESITSVNSDRDRVRIALLSAARESDFLLEATFNRHVSRRKVPITPEELCMLYPMKTTSQKRTSETSNLLEFTDTLKDFLMDAKNHEWKSRRGQLLMTYMIHTEDSESFFTASMGTIQRSDLRRLELLISEYEEPDAIFMNSLTQEIADDVIASCKL
jgi:hypothetical protein